MYIAINGKLYSDNEAVISAYDHGFLYGIGLFETFRTYGGEPFLLEEHLYRLAEGLTELGIPMRETSDSIRRLVDGLLEVNILKEGYFRLSISAGEAALGLPAGDYEQPNVFLYVKELPPRDEKVYSEGKSLQKLALCRNTPEGRVRFKSFHYMNNILAKREMFRYPWSRGAEGLLLTPNGLLAEGIVSNVFFIKGGHCLTPSLDTGILPGITRAFVIKLLQSEGIPVEEGHFTWYDLLQADEVFVTNSIQEIVPITSLYDEEGGRFPIGEAVVGDITARLIERYQQSVSK